MMPRTGTGRLREDEDAAGLALVRTRRPRDAGRCTPSRGDRHRHGPARVPAGRDLDARRGADPQDADRGHAGRPGSAALERRREHPGPRRREAARGRRHRLDRLVDRQPRSRGVRRAQNRLLQFHACARLDPHGPRLAAADRRHGSALRPDALRGLRRLRPQARRRGGRLSGHGAARRRNPGGPHDARRDSRT